MSIPSPQAVVVDGVTKQYGEFLAVDDLSFEVSRGTIYGVLGPNGAGKTTTLRMLNDILVPDRGRITLFGTLAPGLEAARRIGYLPEERGLYPKMRVSEVLQFFGKLRGLSGRDAAARSQSWLERLQIDEWAHHRVQDLSKGMQQKVQFAAALLHDPDLLILDEPWSGLDPINAEVLKSIVQEQKDAGKTVLFSTHLMEQAEQVCDAVCIIARGKMAVEGRLSDIKSQAAGEGKVALVFADDASEERARDTVLADPALVTRTQARKDFLEIELAPDTGPQELLARLVANSLPLARFEQLQPTLHQIFVERVGAGAAANIGDRRRGAR